MLMQCSSLKRRLRELLPVCSRPSAPAFKVLRKLSGMADAVSNLAGPLMCYLAPYLGIP